MTKAAVDEVVKALKARYFNAKRVEKSRILDEFCATTGYHRKAALKLIYRNINRSLKGQPQPQRRRGRKPRYKGDLVLLKALKLLWREMEYMCSKSMKEILPEWLGPFERRCMALDDETRKKVLSVSPATIDRLLAPLRISMEARRGCGTKPGSLLRQQIPIRTGPWDVNKPGFMEADTVAHCGGSMHGQFMWSVTMTDILLQWTEVRAMFHKGQDGALACVREIEAVLPFLLLGVDTDNGNEFLNHHLLRHFTNKNVQFTRSRSYQKNDNAHVEQKNYTHVRQLLGYGRIDNPELVDGLNEVLRDWSTLRNHYFPVRRLIFKEQIGSRVYKRYDAPQTPYARALACADISDEVKTQLRAAHAAIDPVELRRSIRRRLKVLMRVACVSETAQWSEIATGTEGR